METFNAPLRVFGCSLRKLFADNQRSLIKSPMATMQWVALSRVMHQRLKDDTATFVTVDSRLNYALKSCKCYSN